MNRQLRVLSLQPYFGGSHAQFQIGWTAHSQHDWTTLTLPARHWKWRMRHASIYFRENIRSLIDSQAWDIIVCSDMLNVAEFKGLIAADPQLNSNSNSKLVDRPIVVYFHENQFEYPTRKGFKPDQHFPFTNFISALTADKIWFNSRFNFDSLLAGLLRHAKRWPDFQPTEQFATLEAKLDVQSPGIDVPEINVSEFQRRRIKRADQHEPLHLVWAARWEHDKNADDLLAALKLLENNDVPFRLSVIGQSFKYSPAAFDQIKTLFADKIVRWGFQESRQEYWEALGEADVFVSTANHEFFGIAAAEAIATGLHPLFPNRLAYPELLKLAVTTEDQSKFLYDGTAEGLAMQLMDIQAQRSAQGWTMDLDSALQVVAKLGWRRRGGELDQALLRIVDNAS